MNKEFFKLLYRKIFDRKAWKKYRESFVEFNEKSMKNNCIIAEKDSCFPCLDEITDSLNFSIHYVYHPAWAARILAQINPEEHIDISSTINYCTIMSAFIPIKYYEYRPVNFNLSNLKSLKADITKLPFEDNSIYSLSCMHVVEHKGLGRYGDEIDPVGDQKAIQELKRVVKIGGNLLFVVPIGKEKIIFNAHRIYSYDKILQYFSGWKLKEFSLVLDDMSMSNIKCAFGLKQVISGKSNNLKSLNQCFIEKATKEQADQQNYGCGCFWFIKSL